MKIGEYTVTIPLTDRQAAMVSGMLLHAELEAANSEPGAIFLQVGRTDSGQVAARGGFLPSDKAAAVQAIINDAISAEQGVETAPERRCVKCGLVWAPLRCHNCGGVRSEAV